MGHFINRNKIKGKLYHPYSLCCTQVLVKFCKHRNQICVRYIYMIEHIRDSFAIYHSCCITLIVIHIVAIQGVTMITWLIRRLLALNLRKFAIHKLYRITEIKTEAKNNIYIYIYTLKNTYWKKQKIKFSRFAMTLLCIIMI